MRVLITGATGFIGRALLLRLLRDGHAVTAWVRSPERARSQLGAEVQLIDARTGDQGLRAAVAAADAIVNLAGEPIAGGRWSKARRARILASRVGLTERIVAAIAAAATRPRVLISASAVGFYGDRGDERLDEDSPPGQGFLSEVCVAWEQAARAALPLGVRVVTPRLGVVLGLGGGFFGQLYPLFRAGLGARLGNGRQFVPWIHLTDVIDAFTSALDDARFTGAVDLVAPEAVRMGALTAALGRAARRAVLVGVPAPLLRLGLGRAAAVVLGSQRLEGQRLRGLGVHARFATLTAALADLTDRLGAVAIERVPAPLTPLVDRAYLAQRRPRYQLRSRVGLDAPVPEAFGFFSRPENLGVITPAAMALEIVSAPAAIAEGSVIDYTIRVARMALRWRTSIQHWAPGAAFVDAQERGPYRTWWHEHRFTAEGAGTLMEDRVYYALPFGPLGRLFHHLFVADQLRGVFACRAQAIELRFRARAPTAEAGQAPAKR